MHDRANDYCRAARRFMRTQRLVLEPCIEVTLAMTASVSGTVAMSTIPTATTSFKRCVFGVPWLVQLSRVAIVFQA